MRTSVSLTGRMSEMPNRIIREGILTSERVNLLTEKAELFYRRLLSVVDDFGRYYAQPTLLRAACYPLRLDAVSDADVLDCIDECVAAGLIGVYTVGGKRFLVVCGFGQNIRAKASKFPAPPSGTCDADATQMHSTCDADDPQGDGECIASAPGDGDGCGCVDVDDKERERGVVKRKPRSPRGSRIPPDFPDADALRWCQENHPALDVRFVMDKFRDYWTSVPGAKGVKADWPATWRNFCRREFPRPDKSTPARYDKSAAQRGQDVIAALTGRTKPQEVIDVEPTRRALGR